MAKKNKINNVLFMITPADLLFYFIILLVGTYVPLFPVIIIGKFQKNLTLIQLFWDNPDYFSKKI